MSQYTQVLETNEHRHFEVGDHANLRGKLLDSLERDGKFLGGVPPAKRAGFRTWAIHWGQRVYAKAYALRYLDAPVRDLEPTFDQEMGLLRNAIHCLIKDWERTRAAGNAPTGGHGLAHYPRELLHNRLATVLREAFDAGAHDGYIARKRRLAEGHAHGIAPLQVAQWIQSEKSAILAHEGVVLMS